jgi:lon-related putative ATP-dependent protease
LGSALKLIIVAGDHTTLPPTVRDLRGRGDSAKPVAVTIRLDDTRLHRAPDAAALPFTSCDELQDLPDVVGQARATEALRFGLGIRRKGFNLFVLGSQGTGRHSMVRRFVQQRAEKEPVPEDWVYVHDFERPHRPKALKLPTGRARAMQRDVDTFLEALPQRLQTALQSEAHRNRRRALERGLERRRAKRLRTLEIEANEKKLTLSSHEDTLGFSPLYRGKPMTVEQFAALSEKRQEQIEGAIDAMETRLQTVLLEVEADAEKIDAALDELDREVAATVVDSLINRLKAKHEDLPELALHFDAMRRDLVKHHRDVLPQHDDEGDDDEERSRPPPSLGVERTSASVSGTDVSPLRRYKVNVLVDRAEQQGAPVVTETNPTLENLLGQVEYAAHLGALVTDFLLIKPGAMHRANGGYLILDAERVLSSPQIWEFVVRALSNGELRPKGREAAGEALTGSLDPLPIPLSLKVIVVGERSTFEALETHDPQFPDLFKVLVDLDEDIERSAEHEFAYARWIATFVRWEKLRTLDRDAVLRLLEGGARLAGDRERLSARLGLVADVIREADWWAADAGSETITLAHVQRAIEAQRTRAGRMRQAVHDDIRRGVLRIESSGERVGQVNGLAVLDVGRDAFGIPLRITATVRVGRGEVVDVEREAEMGGPTHTKGVMILAGFLGQRYAVARPLSLTASLVFEQSYHGVEGDSASAAELCAMLSALAEVPVKQTIAITGSVDQQGRVQSVGGVNEKIEGFFEVCLSRGLDGTQGVIIPAANERTVMLREEVRAACRDGMFHVWIAATIDEAVERLTGVAAGERDELGNWSAGSVNARADARLQAFAALRREYQISV